MFEDWETHQPATFSDDLFEGYDTESPDWDWERMKRLVVQRVIERGDILDYYALLQLYGGFGPVRAVVRRLPHLSKLNINWVCRAFDLKKEDLAAYRNQLQQEEP